MPLRIKTLLAAAATGSAVACLTMWVVLTYLVLPVEISPPPQSITDQFRDLWTWVVSLVVAVVLWIWVLMDTKQPQIGGTASTRNVQRSRE